MNKPEEITDSASGTIKRKSYVGNFLVHIQTETFLPNVVSNEILYLHRDHLGSVESITDASATLIRRMTFDPFGDRRNDDWENTNTAFDTAIIDASFNLTSSGFTGHEHLDNHDLIHMGGRLYDPVLGRFTSADPYIQAPTFSQSFNRYSYVLNNPLSYVDPTGYIYEISIAAGGGFSGFGGGFSGFNAWMWQPQPVFYFSPSIFTQAPFQPSIPAPQVANFGAATQTADANAQAANQPNNFVEQASGNPPAATQDGFHKGQAIQEIVVPAQQNNPAQSVANKALEDNHLTLNEANKVWRANNDSNFEVTVDASKLSVTQLKDFGPNGYAPGKVRGVADWLVHGSVSLSRDAQGNITIPSAPYDFQPHGSFWSSPVRNFETYGGFYLGSGAGTSVGTDFLINYSGSPNVSR